MRRPTEKTLRNKAILIAVSLCLLIDHTSAFTSRSTLAIRQLPYSTVLRSSLKPKDETAAVSSSSTISDSEVRDQIQAQDPFEIGSSNDISVIHGQQLEEKESGNDEIGIWAARGILLLVAMLWGTNFASVKYLETLCFHPPCHHPPSEAAFARFGVAALVSLPLLVGQRKDVIMGGLECGLWITMGYVTQAMALKSIASGECAFICSLTVVIVPLLSWILYGKPLKPVNLISAALALAGVGVLEGLINVNDLMGVPSAVAADSDTSMLLANNVASSSVVESASAGPVAALAKSIGIGKGDLLALGQPFGFGLAFMRIEHYVEKFKDVENRVLTLSAAQCLAVGFCSLLWVLYDYHGTLPDFGYLLEYHRIIAIAWTGIMTTVVAIYFEGIALQVASATEAALTFASEPVWASLFGAVLLRERLQTESYIGGTIILMACVIGAVADLPSGQDEKDDKPTIDVDASSP